MRAYDNSTPVHAISSIQLGSDAINNTISVTGNSYHSNTGVNAHALYGITTGALSNDYSVSQFDGGGLAIDVECHDSSCSGNVIAIANCDFINNTATAGAVVVRVSSGLGERGAWNYSPFPTAAGRITLRILVVQQSVCLAQDQLQYLLVSHLKTAHGSQMPFPTPPVKCSTMMEVWLCCNTMEHLRQN